MSGLNPLAIDEVINRSRALLEEIIQVHVVSLQVEWWLLKSQLSRKRSLMSKWTCSV
jgi:hypothetical protein